jgi:hypothetical protein
MDNITKTNKPNSTVPEFEILENNYQYESEDVRLLSYRILVNKFNEKYGFLGENQKTTLREFILNISNSNNLKTFIINEIVKIEEFIVNSKSKIKDDILNIKLNELLRLTTSLKEIKSVTDDHVIKLLKLQELKNELGRVI